MAAQKFFCGNTVPYLPTGEWVGILVLASLGVLWRGPSGIFCPYLLRTNLSTYVEYKLRRGSTEKVHMCDFSRYYCAVSQSGCTYIHAQQPTLVFWAFFILVILVGVQWGWHTAGSHPPDQRAPLPVLMDHLDTFFGKAEFSTSGVSKFQVLVWILPGCGIYGFCELRSWLQTSPIYSPATETTQKDCLSVAFSEGAIWII